MNKLNEPKGGFEPADEVSPAVTSTAQPTAPPQLTPAEAAQRNLRARTQQAHENRRRVEENRFDDSERARICAKHDSIAAADRLEGRTLFGGGSHDDQMRLRAMRINQEFERLHPELLVDGAYETAAAIARERIADGAHERLSPTEFADVVAHITARELAARTSGQQTSQSIEARSKYVADLQKQRQLGSTRGRVRNFK